ncbi:MAG: hypothetical protein ICV60_01235 [Pyrinomonadaceae bacterium]|nr:hypothetical protein [Pyrinomonadaceae bacterium]
MKQFFATLLLIIGASMVSAQTADAPATAQEKPECTLTVAQLPGIAGLRLGMTIEQVLALFPGSSKEQEIVSAISDAPSRLGAVNITIKPERYESKAKFAGISNIFFAFLDGRLFRFIVGYNGVEWKNVDEFITKFSSENGLPAVEAWEARVGMETQMKTLKCAGVDVTLFASTGGAVNHANITDTATEQTLKERRAKAQEKSTQ